MRAGAGFTQLGSKSPFIVLNVDGTERTVWAHHEAMRSKIKERIQEHGPIQPGERVVVRRNPEKRTSASGYGYFPYFIEFPDLPEPDRYDVFKVDKKEDDKEEPSPAEPNDDIPFMPR